VNPSTISAPPRLVAEHPIRLAQQIAQLLDSDPIAAGQAKEHLSPERLRELFDLPPAHTTTVREAVDNCDATEADFEDYFRDEVLNTLTAESLVEEMRERGKTKADFLEIVNNL